MTNLDIDIFLTLLQNHNITKTAEQLFLSQSTISRRLELLEKEIGKPLILRGKGQKNITLTPYGEDFITLANRWKALYEETTQLQYHSNSMELSIGGVHSINNYILLPFYRELRHYCPSITLSLYTHHSWEIYEFINMHKIDIGFVNHISYNTNLKTSPIFRERFCLLCSDPDSSLYHTSVHPNQLDPAKEIFHTWSSEFQQWHDSWWGKASRAPVTVNEANLLALFISHPGEWSILPVSVAKELQAHHPLRICSLLESPPDRICYMVTHRNARTKCIPALSLFQNHLTEFLKQNKLANVV